MHYLVLHKASALYLPCHSVNFQTLKNLHKRRGNTRTEHSAELIDTIMQTSTEDSRVTRSEKRRSNIPPYNNLLSLQLTSLRLGL